ACPQAAHRLHLVAAGYRGAWHDGVRPRGDRWRALKEQPTHTPRQRIRAAAPCSERCVVPPSLRHREEAPRRVVCCPQPRGLFTWGTGRLCGGRERAGSHVVARRQLERSGARSVVRGAASTARSSSLLILEAARGAYASPITAGVTYAPRVSSCAGEEGA